MTKKKYCISCIKENDACGNIKLLSSALAMRTLSQTIAATTLELRFCTIKSY